MHVVFNIAKYSILFLLAAAVTTFMFYYTGFVATVYFYFLFFVLFRLLLKFIVRTHDSFQNAQYSLFIALTLLLLVETVIYYTQVNRPLTSAERLEQDFYSYTIDAGFYIAPESNREIEIKTSEFIHYRKTNSEGIRNEKLGAKHPDEIRILCLGDSFTEGIGTTEDSTWLVYCKAALNQKCPKAQLTMINAGIGGSDVFFAVKLLQNRLLSYKPDIVVVLTNVTDVFDYMERGGFKRFREDGSVRYNSKHVFEPLYNHSFIYRQIAHGIMGLDETFNTQQSREIKESEAIDSILSTYSIIESLGNQNNFQTIVAIMPMHSEILNSAYSNTDFPRLITGCRNGYDLMDCMSGQVSTLTMDVDSSWFYWPIDLHFNGKGYKILGECISQCLLGKFPCN